MRRKSFQTCSTGCVKLALFSGLTDYAQVEAHIVNLASQPLMDEGFGWSTAYGHKMHVYGPAPVDATAVVRCRTLVFCPPILFQIR
jgi:hypothetical protein